MGRPTCASKEKLSDSMYRALSGMPNISVKCSTKPGHSSDNQMFIEGRNLNLHNIKQCISNQSIFCRNQAFGKNHHCVDNTGRRVSSNNFSNTGWNAARAHGERAHGSKLASTMAMETKHNPMQQL